MSDSKTPEENANHFRHLAEEARRQAARLDGLADQMEAGEPLGPVPDLDLGLLSVPEVVGLIEAEGQPAAPGQVQVGAVREPEPEPEPAKPQADRVPLGVRWDQRISHSARLKLLGDLGMGVDPELARFSWQGLPNQVRRALLERWS